MQVYIYIYMRGWFLDYTENGKVLLKGYKNY